MLGIIAASIICIILTYFILLHTGGIPGIIERGVEYSIGIYSGDTPFELEPDERIQNPVLTGKDVTDIDARFVADPFMIQENRSWYMFFEVYNEETRQGDIGFASSPDALHWDYGRIVLDEAFHLSYPFVFRWEDEIYMIPESKEVESVRLYKAIGFPTEWNYLRDIVHGRPFTDPSIYQYNGEWWLFVDTSENENPNSMLSLYRSDALEGPWEEHPESPIVENNPDIARPAGRVGVFGGNLIRLAQNEELKHGREVRAFNIGCMNQNSYEETPVGIHPIVSASGTGWNARGMHHVDAHQLGTQHWIACVDGYFRYVKLAIVGKIRL